MAAKSLTTGRTGLFGILNFQGYMGISAPQVLQTSIGIFTHAGITPLVLYGKPEIEESCLTAIHTAVDARVDGVLVIHSGHRGFLDFIRHHLFRIRDYGISVVSIGPHPLPGFSSYSPDFAQGIQQAARHLLDQGCQTLALIHRRELVHQPFSDQIRKSVEATLRQSHDHGSKASLIIPEPPANLPEPQLKSYSNIHIANRLGYAEMWDLIERNQVPDGVMCERDRLAFGAMRACAEAGLRIPEDILVTGYGNEPDSSATYIPLTSVAEPMEELCCQAVRELTGAVSENRTTHRKPLKLPCQLVIRRSSERRAAASS